MAEVAGLTLGALGVVGVFSVCVQAFDMVQIARTQDRALQILSTKLDNRKARFMIWGESLDLDKPDRPDSRLQHPVISDRICQTCNLIYNLFADSSQVRRRYGLREDMYGMSTQSMRPQKSVWSNLFGKTRNGLDHHENNFLRLNHNAIIHLYG
jgi:hypothetical protein